jgi:alpha-glucosidase
MVLTSDEVQDFELPTIPTTLMHRPFTLEEFKEVTLRWQTYKMNEGFWNRSVYDIHPLHNVYTETKYLHASLYLENHDQPRSVSRFSHMSISSTPSDPHPLNGGIDPDARRALLSKLLALYLTTLRGTLFVYQGQEIGMANFSPDWPLDEYKDGSTARFWNA